MTPENILKNLESLGTQFGIEIRNEKGDFDGGYCILKSERVIVINKKLSPQRKIIVISKAFENFGMPKNEISKELREAIEDEFAKLKAS
ncbi:MAG: hypothetical protein O3A55_05345 [Bacteroidetes bacterium]|nr:hypothetical protein [Bacteroidota bacterium]